MYIFAKRAVGSDTVTVAGPNSDYVMVVGKVPAAQHGVVVPILTGGATVAGGLGDLAIATAAFRCDGGAPVCASWLMPVDLAESV